MSEPWVRQLRARVRTFGELLSSIPPSLHPRPEVVTTVLGSISLEAAVNEGVACIRVFAETVRINHVAYNLHAYAYRQGLSGNWTLIRPGTAGSSLHLRRRDDLTAHASEAARRQIENVLRPLISAWGEAHTDSFDAALRHDWMWRVSRWADELTRPLEGLAAALAAKPLQWEPLSAGARRLNEFEADIAFDESLAIGATVTVCWTNSWRRLCGRGEVVRLSPRRVTARLTEPVSAGTTYEVGREITVPRIGDLKAWSHHNRVRPVEPLAQP